MASQPRAVTSVFDASGMQSPYLKERNKWTRAFACVFGMQGRQSSLALLITA